MRRILIFQLQHPQAFSSTLLSCYKQLHRTLQEQEREVSQALVLQGK